MLDSWVLRSLIFQFLTGGPTNSMEKVREIQTSIKKQSPISGVKKESETHTPLQQTDTNESRKLGFSRLMDILRDLGYRSDRLDYIKNNMDLIPGSLSLVELHSILDLFSYTSDKFKVINLLLSRLPDSLSLSELHRILNLFSYADDRFKVIQVFLPRLPEIE